MSKSSLAPLSSVAQVISGFAFKSTWFEPGLDKIVRISDLVNGQVSLTRSVTFNVEKHPVSSKYKVQNGDILVALSGATVGKIGVVSADTAGAYLNQRLAIVRGYQKENTEYLSHILRSQYMHQLLPSAEGAAQPNLSPKLLESLQIPIPSVKKQRQIAVHLKVQLTEVENARQAAELQSAETTKLANAIISNSIQKENTEKYFLADVLQEVKQGIGEDWKNYPVLGATRNGLAPAKEPPGKYPQRYKPVFPGTVFYNPMRIMIGSIAFVDEENTPGITSPDYVALKGKEGLLDSRWFYYWLRSPLGEACINSLARGAVRERMLFNRLAKGTIELPKYSIQQASSQALKEIVPMRKSIENKIRDIKLLPAKLLAREFEMK